jgi:hypothetical protein
MTKILHDLANFNSGMLRFQQENFPYFFLAFSNTRRTQTNSCGQFAVLTAKMSPVKFIFFVAVSSSLDSFFSSTLHRRPNFLLFYTLQNFI